MDINSEQETDGADFFEALMSHVMTGVDIPKLQMERVLGPIIGMFIEDIISTQLNESVITLSPEFPLRKAADSARKQNWQSTNIDWLMYSVTQGDLICIELKTNDGGFRSGQAGLYQGIQARIRDEKERGAQFLKDDLDNIARSSKESGKYRSVIKAVTRILPDFSLVRSCRTVYILPETAKPTVDREKWSEVMFLSFSELRISERHRYRKYWDILHSALKLLDTQSRTLRNARSRS